MASDLVTLLGGAVGGALFTGGTNVGLALRADHRKRRAVFRRVRAELLDCYEGVRLLHDVEAWEGSSSLTKMVERLKLHEDDDLPEYLSDRQFEAVQAAYASLRSITAVHRHAEGDPELQPMVATVMADAVEQCEVAFDVMRPWWKRRQVERERADRRRDSVFK